MSVTIGIDLGTTNSAVAWHDGKKTEIIETSSGQLLLPSVVMVQEDGSLKVGRQAQLSLRRDMDPRYVFSNIKRHIGMPFSEGEDYGKQVINHDGMRWFIGPDDMNYSPEELSAEILKTLKAAAERRLGKTVTKAVIAVPAYFNPDRIKKTQDAAALAGLKATIWTEPQLAAIANNVEREEFARVAVFDIGGGTFDIVLLEAGRGHIEPLAVGGNDELGGADFDNAVMRYVMEAYREREGVDLSQGAVSEIKLMPAVEEAKKELSDSNVTEVAAQSVHYDTETGKTYDVRERLTLETFNEVTKRFVDQAMAITRRTLEQANLQPTDFTEVLLVGGMTRVPAVRQAVIEMFGEKRVRDGLNPDWAVVIGAAMVAAREDGRLKPGSFESQITAKPFGIETTGGKFMPILPAGTPYGEVESVILTNAHDQQCVVPIDILQGDSVRAEECHVVARHDHKVTPGPKRGVAIILELMVDENGNVLASGHDLDTDEKFSIGA